MLSPSSLLVSLMPLPSSRAMKSIAGGTLYPSHNNHKPVQNKACEKEQNGWKLLHKVIVQSRWRSVLYAMLQVISYAGQLCPACRAGDKLLWCCLSPNKTVRTANRLSARGRRQQVVLLPKVTLPEKKCCQTCDRKPGENTRNTSEPAWVPWHLVSTLF